MNYSEIDQIMLSKGIFNDPAFGDELAILIEPTPNLDGCPLGLYYPDDITIIIPPDGTEGAVLHELGHRHGHYYYDDLSERYAEDFRKIYQPKGKALLYMGNHFERLPRFGVLFEEGEKGAVEVATLYPPTPDEIHELRYQLYSYSNGEGIPKICYGGGEFPFVRFEFIRGIDWPMIVGAVGGGLLAATIGIVSYAVYKVAKEYPWTIPIVAVGIPLSLIMLGVPLARKLAKRYISA